jgi:hypothetical protein
MKWEKPSQMQINCFSNLLNSRDHLVMSFRQHKALMAQNVLENYPIN